MQIFINRSNIKSKSFVIITKLLNYVMTIKSQFYIINIKFKSFF